MKRLLVPFLVVAEVAALVLAVPLTVVTGVDFSAVPLVLDRAGTWAKGKKLGGPA